MIQNIDKGKRIENIIENARLKYTKLVFSG